MNVSYVLLFVILLLFLYILLRIISFRLIRANLRVLFLKSLSIFNKNNIEYWVDFGTLIGIHREKDIIIGDTDCDVCVWEKDAAKIKPVLENHGDDELVFKDLGWAFRFYYKYAFHIDIYKAKIDFVNNLVKIPDSRDTPKDLLTEFQVVDVPFYNRTIRIREPVKWEKLLEFRYTKEWKIQMHKWWLGYHSIKNVKLS